MILTNYYNLPRGIYQAVINSIQKPQPDVIRVTQLIAPPIMRQLTFENWDIIERDASEFLWSLLGSGVHAVLAKHDNKALIETRCTLDTHSQQITINGTLLETDLSGQIDRYEIDEESVDDYKVTSIWSYLLGLKIEWEAQLNLYKFLLETTLGKPVKRLRIHAILRDWMASKAIQRDYPAIPFQTIEVPVWSKQEVLDYIESRYLIHRNESQPCTPDERWQRPPCFAIMKKGQKKAVKATIVKNNERVPMTKADAETQMAMLKGLKLYIEERPSDAIRCKSYCLCRDVCPYNPYRNTKGE